MKEGERVNTMNKNDLKLELERLKKEKAELEDEFLCATVRGVDEEKGIVYVAPLTPEQLEYEEALSDRLWEIEERIREIEEQLGMR